MDILPCELLYHICQYIDQPTDILQMLHVCRRWRSFFMNDKYFLNQWFSLSLKHSVQSSQAAMDSYSGQNFYLSKLNTDQSLLPIKLRSSKCLFLPWTRSEDLSDIKYLFDYHYSLSFCELSHSFSFWIFLPPQYVLNVLTGNCNVTGLNISICSDVQYDTDNGKCVSIANRWVHIVLTRIASQSNYGVWIDGQCISKVEQYHICTLGNLEKYCSIFKILLLRKLENNLSETSTQARIADLTAFKRCLTFIEIQAIHQQQTSIKKVKVGSYIDSCKKHNMKAI